MSFFERLLGGVIGLFTAVVLFVRGLFSLWDLNRVRRIRSM